MIALFTMAKLHIYIRPTNTNNTYLQINTKRVFRGRHRGITTEVKNELGVFVSYFVGGFAALGCEGAWTENLE